ncbi:hypothetical protein LMG1866_04606 [Achromobacter ruhlandii]|uniref:hypothetical protein n=1 Tax=Achromobacter ruhlandii TaxID=72557 RepID=UPI001468FB30|nr:hypothetical protein [Achromobacter ruhlandii]CAB3730618.1 hypothetical protein LMG1866_04606 [Achromobacter ruhlandii]
MANQQASAGQGTALHTSKSGLVTSVERILQRPLTAEDAQHWNAIQDQYGIADDDPIVIILVILGLHQHLVNELPEKIKEATASAIATHRTTLEDQATIVSKGLIAKLAPMFLDASAKPPSGMKVPAWLVVGFGLCCGLAGALLSHFIGR